MTHRSATRTTGNASVERHNADSYSLSGPISMNGFLWALAAIAAVLLLAACGGSNGASTDPTVTTEDQIANGIATQQAIETRIAEGIAATAAAQEGDQPAATATAPAQSTATATAPVPTVAATVEYTPTPAPTATPAPPAPTATPAPPAPTPVPQPTATPEPPTATPAPALPDPIIFERPENGSNFVSGSNGSFAQGSGSWEATAYPVRSYVRSAVYFGISEDVQSHTRLYNTFVASQTGRVEVTVDASWSGVFTTFGIGDMTSNLDLGLHIARASGGGGQATSLGERPTIQPRDDREAVAGNQAFQLIFEVEEGMTYEIELRATCQSIGSRNALASDTECIFDNRSGDGGYVEWSNLRVEYLP